MNLLINHGLPSEKKFLGISKPVIYQEVDLSNKRTPIQPPSYLIAFYSKHDKTYHQEWCENYFIDKFSFSAILLRIKARMLW